MHRLSIATFSTLLVACFPEPPECGESRACPASQDPCMAVACVARVCVETPIESVSCGDVLDVRDVTESEVLSDTSETKIDDEVTDASIDASSDGDVSSSETDSATTEADVADLEAADSADINQEVVPECEGAEQCTLGSLCEVARCEDGRCVFEAKQCVPIDECHQPGVCQPTTGQCTTPVQGNGTPCDDGVRCTWADACTTGVCGGTRAPDDSQLDFNYTMRSSHGSRAAGLASNDTDVFIAVAFPTEEVVEGPVMVDFGRDATLTAVVVNLPASASAGIAIARYTHSGILIEAHLAASSNAPILYTSLTWLASSGLLLTGTYESAITLTSRGGGTVELTTLSQSAATFAFDHHNRVLKAVGIEQAAPVQIPPRVVSNGTDCALIVNLMQDRTASVFDHTGTVVDTFASTGENLAEVWVAWMPACGSLTVDARHIGGGSADGGFTAYPASLSATESLVLGGLAVNGVSFGDRSGGNPVMDFTGRASSVVVVTPASARAIRISDPMTAETGGVAFITGVATAGDEVYFGVPLVGRAELIGDVTRLLVGSPASPTQLALRMALIKLDSTHDVAWMYAVNEDKVPVFGTMDGAAGDVVVATFWREAFPFPSPMPSTAGENLVVSVWDNDGGRWAAPLMNPIAGEEARIVSNDTFPYLSRIPLAPGLFVSGTLEGAAELGVAAREGRGEAGKTSAFLSRINSEDGIGCPAP